MLKIFIFLASVSVTLLVTTKADDHTNILWIFAEDTSPWLGCYDDPINHGHTPNIDSLATSGVLFKRAFAPSPVCSTSRSAVIIGQSAIRFGAHNHRSSRHKNKIRLPKDYKALPQIFNEAGYTTFNHGKKDYNFHWDSSTYNHKLKNHTDFSDLKDMQPFFGQIQIKGGKNNTSKFPLDRKVSPDLVKVPQDYPNHELYKKLVAQHYNAIRMDDDLVGDILEALKKYDLDKNTIVVYFSDHGANNFLRHKQMLTEGGLHVPLIISGPKGNLPIGTTRDDLVNLIDLSATTLEWAGIKSPPWFEGQDLFANDFKERTYIGGHKDRMDHTIDRVRTIRTGEFRYIKNYKLDRILLQPQYRDKKDYTQLLYKLYEEEVLSDIHRDIYFGERKDEELYNVTLDPCMLNDLSDNSNYNKILTHHRKLLNEWESKGDHGEELESIYELKANGDNAKWGTGVNVEYEKYRIDSDGDGLSDIWEMANNRDPNDSLLYYEFDCGGWQTEGWYSNNISSNLAGYLGYLDFKLDDPSSLIQRDELDLKIKPNSKIKLKMSSTKALEITTIINNKIVGKNKIGSSKKLKMIELPINISYSTEDLNTLGLKFEGGEGAFIKIDSIRMH